ncbi:MAG: M28 family peptidase [Maribacter sp.]|nr:M28 family peptidase [Maribacter sp.]
MGKFHGVWLLSFLLLISTLGLAQEAGPQDDYFKRIRPTFTGNIAYETTAFIEKYWRVAGNTGFNKSIHYVAAELEKAGYVLETQATEKNRLTYRIEKKHLEDPTWEPIDASATIVGEEAPFLKYSTNRNMIYLNSVSTPKKGITAEVVPIENIEDFNAVDVKDKIIFTELPVNGFYETAIDQGALGIVTYNNPDYLQPEKNTTSIQFRSLPYRKESQLWGIALSFEAKEKLKKAFEKGKVALKVAITTKIYNSEELTLVADVKGSLVPDERLVFSAHIQEPGANDNATGVGTQLEMAVVTAKLLTSKQIDISRTLTFLWGDEIASTARYIAEDETRASKIKWGISLDMVGENTRVTGGSFLIEKMPDPSAIWTRGRDRHTEWGEKVLSLAEMKPHYLNDLIISIFKKQGEFANWSVDTNPFEGGSDHTPFLKANIPGLLLWHFTDQFYHTDNDRLNKVSKETMKNVGTGALVSAFTLLNSNGNTALAILKILKSAAELRIEQEFLVSKDQIQAGSTIPQETRILKAWEQWYLQSFVSLNDMVLQPNEFVNRAISNAQSELSITTAVYLNKLKE